MPSWQQLAVPTTAAAVLAVLWLWRRTRTKDFKLVGHVSSLIVYPVKSCAAIYLDKAECTELGIKYDRSWLIINEADNCLVTQRQEPSLALVKPYFEDGFWWLSAPGMSTDLKLDPNLNGGETKIIDVFGINGEGMFTGVEAAEWISEYLKKTGLGIYYMASGLKPRHLWDMVNLRHVTRQKDKAGFSDFSPYMVLSEASVADLNTRVEKPKSIKSFRPSIIVTGCEAFCEDKWKQMRIGDVSFTGLDNCPRCSLTAVDQETGIKDTKFEALKTLRSYRLHSNRKLYGQSPSFGFFYGIDKTGIIRVGDAIYAI